MSYNYQKFLKNNHYSNDPENSQPPPLSQPYVSHFESNRQHKCGLYQLNDVPTRSQAPCTHGTQAKWGEVQQLHQQVTDLVSMVSSLPSITIKPDPDAPSEVATGPENSLPTPPSVPALIRGHNTVSSLQFNNNPNLKLHLDDYSPCSYMWTVSDWGLHVDAQTLATKMQGGHLKGIQGQSAQLKSINICNTYFVNNLTVHSKMKATWFTLLKHHRSVLLPQTWGQMDSGTLTWFIAANCRVSPVLWLCSDNWKLLELGKHYYSRWRDQYAPWLKPGSGNNDKSVCLSKQGNTKNTTASSLRRTRSSDAAENIPCTSIGSVPGPSKCTRTNSSESVATSSSSLSHDSSMLASSFDVLESADDALALSTPLADALAKYPSSNVLPFTVKGKEKAKAGKISPSLPAPHLIATPAKAVTPTPTPSNTPQPTLGEAPAPAFAQPLTEQTTLTPMASGAPQLVIKTVGESIPIAPEGNTPASG
ncbi:hypothetical protein CONPUDRAFT_73048 [Coniophora puteana RWD-64-598 SS2]|uniref:Uncharacterized protein n=1 Tax=Coniophora puteana (strain RWD-64-598) TaxID=741705 RepID=A0A5M3MQ11_CONPW|nr:uncharacterized protein CONPUDRAFT_73048 [Coniophora puteana RWD-64-598 SS2]EIW81272.1 hypothetical protein CONPUDRAFT_73048 [Coniophora puteana RWD-64-598 SS2]